MSFLEIQEFNLNNMMIMNQSVGNLFIIGQNDWKKFKLVKKLITIIDEQIEDVNKMIFVSSNKHNIYNRIVPTECLCDTIDNDSLDQVTTLCHAPNAKPILLVIDCDVHNIASIQQKLSEIIMSSRHLKLSLILTCDRTISMSPEIRSNFDYVFALSNCCTENQTRQLEYLYNNYFGVFPTFTSFKDVLFQIDEANCLIYSAREHHRDNLIKISNINE